MNEDILDAMFYMAVTRTSLKEFLDITTNEFQNMKDKEEISDAANNYMKETSRTLNSVLLEFNMSPDLARGISIGAYLTLAVGDLSKIRELVYAGIKECFIRGIHPLTGEKLNNGQD